MSRSFYLSVAGVVRPTEYGIFIDEKDLASMIFDAIGEDKDFAGHLTITLMDLSEEAKTTKVGEQCVGTYRSDVDRCSGVPEPVANDKTCTGGDDV